MRINAYKSNRQRDISPHRNDVRNVIETQKHTRE